MPLIHEQRARWQQAAEASGEVEAGWTRAGLDMWARVCMRARERNVNPDELITTALAVPANASK